MSRLPSTTNPDLIERGREDIASPVPGPPKTRVIITNAVYVTYRTVLYYVRPFAPPVLQLIDGPLNIALHEHDRLCGSLVQLYTHGFTGR